MWFLNRFEPESTAYNIPVAIRLSGSLDVAALQAAVSDVVARHEVLRTVYPEVDGVGFQEILSVDRVVLDLSPVVVSESGVVAAVSEFLSAGFDVVSGVGGVAGSVGSAGGSSAACGAVVRRRHSWCVGDSGGSSGVDGVGSAYEHDHVHGGACGVGGDVGSFVR